MRTYLGCFVLLYFSMNAMNTKLTGPDVAHLADLTSTGKLALYVRNDPAIDTMFEVDASLKLEDVAAAFLSGSEEDINLIVDWHAAGLLVMGIPENLGAAAMCIRCEPYYLFQMTGGRYE
jgi:hypothetical protein